MKNSRRRRRRRSRLKVVAEGEEDRNRTALKTLAPHQRRDEAERKADVRSIVMRIIMRDLNHREAGGAGLRQRIVMMMPENHVIDQLVLQHRNEAAMVSTCCSYNNGEQQ